MKKYVILAMVLALLTTASSCTLYNCGEGNACPYSVVGWYSK